MGQMYLLEILRQHKDLLVANHPTQLAEVKHQTNLLVRNELKTLFQGGLWISPQTPILQPLSLFLFQVIQFIITNIDLLYIKH